MKLSDVKKEFAKYIVMSDDTILDVIFGTLAGNMLINQDPVWLMIVAPSSAGKTTFISPIESIRSITFVDDLTEKTLLSGFKIKGKEVSLLKKIGSGIMAFSDFTSILSKNPMSRGEILAQLKLVYDRKVTKYTGTGGIDWEGKIGVIAGSTPDIYSFMEGGRAMGERFIYYWLEQADNNAIMKKQAEVNKSSKDINDIMRDWYDNYFIELSNGDYHPIPILTQEQSKRLNAASIFCVNGKATIKTDFKTGKPIGIPNVAGVGRDTKIFNTLISGLLLMRQHDTRNKDAKVTNGMIQIVEKCAYSSINRERRKVMEILVEEGSSLTASQIGSQKGLGLEKDAVELYLRPLHAVGLVTKETQGRQFRWSIKDQWQIDFIKRVSGNVQEIMQAQAIESQEETTDDWITQMEQQSYGHSKT